MQTWILLLVGVTTRMVVDGGSSRVTTLYTIKKFDFDFSENFFTNITAFYLPVRGKWGRVHVNLTVAKEIDQFWMDVKTYRQDETFKTFESLTLEFSVNLCELNENLDKNVLFQFIRGLKKHMRCIISHCPLERGTKVIVPDRTLKQVPRKGSFGPIIPSGLYKFVFNMRNDQNCSLGSIEVQFQFRGF